MAFTEQEQFALPSSILFLDFQSRWKGEIEKKKKITKPPSQGRILGNVLIQKP